MKSMSINMRQYKATEIPVIMKMTSMEAKSILERFAP